MSETKTLPVLPLRDIVVFPHMVVPLFVGREKSVAALEAAMAGDKDIFLLAQLDPGCDDPERDDLYDVGVVATILFFQASGMVRDSGTALGAVVAFLTPIGHHGNLLILDRSASAERVRIVANFGRETIMLDDGQAEGQVLAAVNGAGPRALPALAARH